MPRLMSDEKLRSHNDVMYVTACKCVYSSTEKKEIGDRFMGVYTSKRL